MATRRVQLDRKGVAALLKSALMGVTVKAATEAVADNIRSQGIRVGDTDGGPLERDLPVTTKVVITDRAHGLVTIAHPAGQAVQAKHGVLSKAAAQAGLDVRAK